MEVTSRGDGRGESNRGEQSCPEFQVVSPSCGRNQDGKGRANGTGGGMRSITALGGAAKEVLHTLRGRRAPLKDRPASSGGTSRAGPKKDKKRGPFQPVRELFLPPCHFRRLVGGRGAKGLKKTRNWESVLRLSQFLHPVSPRPASGVRPGEVTSSGSLVAGGGHACRRQLHGDIRLLSRPDRDTLLALYRLAVGARPFHAERVCILVAGFERRRHKDAPRRRRARGLTVDQQPGIFG